MPPLIPTRLAWSRRSLLLFFSIGVLDGQYEYVYYLDTNKGELRPLNEARIWNLDRSADHPERAAQIALGFQDMIPRSY